MSERQELELAIEALEAQRAVLGDSVVNAALVPLREKLASLGAVEPAVEPKAEPLGERRVVTVLFCDVVGSTALAEQVDPEEWTRMMNAIFERLNEPVDRYGGTVSRLMGDAILAFFGAPVAHENDPERALLAGLAILKNIEPLRDRLMRETGLDFNVRVGINTGLVVAGHVGSEVRSEYTAMGDTVNLAARMEQTAQPGTLQISENTYKQVATLFDVKPLGSISVKGKTEPMPAYVVLRRKTEPGLVRGLTTHGIDSPLVGRKTEFAAVGDAVARARDGQGGIIAVIGEAGVGKSRLIAEIRQGVQPDRVTWLEGHALSFGHSISYWPFQEMLRSYADISENDSSASAWQKLEAKVINLFDDDGPEVLPYIASFLSLEVSGDYAERIRRLDGEATGRQLLRAMRRLFQAMAEAQPLVIFIDDLHWVDSSSVKLIEHLLPLARQAPILFMIATRPEAESLGASLQQLAHEQYWDIFEQISLDPLTAKDSVHLAKNLLAIENMPESLRTTIIQKADGNPFFMEEIIRSLIDLRAIVRDDQSGHWHVRHNIERITIPDTLQAVIMTRIDRLDAKVKQVLNEAAVIGRTFFYRILKTIAAADEDLDDKLLQLQTIELINEKQQLPELEYVFKHAVAHEVAYESILLQRRRELHAQVGAAIERLFEERLDEYFGLLAYHYSHAGDTEKAQKYLLKTADQASGIAANAEALTNYQQALKAYKRSVGDQVDPVVLAELEVKIGWILVRLGEHFAGLTHFEQAMTLLGRPVPTTKGMVKRAIAVEAAKQLGYQLFPRLFLKDKGRSLTLAEEIELSINARMNSVLVLVDGERFLENTLRGLNRSRFLANQSEIARSSAYLGIAFSVVGRFKLATRYFKQAFVAAEEAQDSETLSLVHHSQAVSASISADWDLVIRHTKKGSSYARESGNLVLYCYNLIHASGAFLSQGEFETAEELYEIAIGTSEGAGAIQQTANGHFVRGWRQRLKGNIAAAISEQELAIELSDRVPDYWLRCLSTYELTRCYLQMDRIAEASELVDSTQALVEEYASNHVMRSCLVQAKAEIYLFASEMAKESGMVEGNIGAEWLRKAKSACTDALKYSRANRSFIPEARRCQGIYEWLHGETTKALDWWRKSVAFSRARGMRPAEATMLLEMGQRMDDKTLIAQAKVMMDEMKMVHAQRTMSGAIVRAVDERRYRMNTDPGSETNYDQLNS